MAPSNRELEHRLEALRNELAGAREQQAATNAILGTIAASPVDLKFVLNAVAEYAGKLCDAFDATIYLKRADGLTVAAHCGSIPIDFAELPLKRDLVTSRAVLDKITVHIQDLAAAGDEYPSGSMLAQRLGFRTILATPLLRKGEAIGALTIRRAENRPFTDAQVGLLKTFADQAIIAIENARLFEQVQKKTSQLTEALQQQTATADVLKVISRSAFDLQTVLDRLAESAARLCEADIVDFYRSRNDGFEWAASFGEAESERDHTVILRQPGGGSVSGRVLLEHKTVHVADFEADPEFTFVAVARKRGIRAILGVPLLRGEELIGLLLVMRKAPGPFATKQIELAETFADQAVIAIENVRLFEEVEARNRDLTESLERQTAMSDILRVISRSPTNVQPVFETIAESAARLCSARFCSVFRFDGELIHFVAQHGMPPAGVDAQRRAFPMHPGQASGASRAILRGTVEQIPDVNVDPDYQIGDTARAIGARSVLAVPMLRDGRPVGSINIGGQETGFFPARQIELLQTFADQAVIAIENVRLFEEVQARNRELSEALEQQTATAAILGAIAASPTDIQPVLSAVARSAAQLCDAYDAAIFLRDGHSLRIGAHHGPIPIDFKIWPIARDWVTGRAVADRKTVHVHDLIAAGDEYPAGMAMSRRLGHRTILSTPLLREGEAIGALIIRRTEVRPFTEKQIELLQTFANQAAIAIANVRLFDEVQARTRDLTESLERQTAASELLRVIARSPTDIQPVFDTIATSVAHLCAARHCIVFGFDGKLVQFVAQHGLPREVVAGNREAYPMPPGRESAAARAILSRSVEQIPDVEADPDYAHTSIARRGKVRSLLAVPMLKEEVPVGAIVVARQQVGLFPDRQIDLLKSFADQAVIAIENVRLFEEVQERTREVTEALEQQTATSEVLKVISSSPTDIRPVLDAVGQSAARLCEADNAVIFLLNGNVLRQWGTYGLPMAPGRASTLEGLPVSRDTVTGRAVAEGRTVHVHDLSAADSEYPEGSRHARIDGHRTTLATPLLRKGVPIGAILIRRMEVRPFSRKQIDLLTTFADQAAIAIANVRLFDEVQARTAEVTEALQQQTATADVLKVISRSAFDLDAVLQTLVDSAIRLCGADKGAITLREGDDLLFRAGAGQSPELRAYEQANPHRLGRGTFQGRAAIEGTTIHVPDVLADPEYERKETAALGIRAVLSVPLKRGAEVIGVFGLARATVGAFAPRQIELVESFADQAVIAIENARLFEEVQAKTRDLEESLTFQKATSSVLEVIGRSASNLQPVFDVILDTAADLCYADMSVLRLMRDGALHHVADSRRNDPAVVQHSRENPILPTDRSSVAGRVALAGHTIHVPDMAKDEELTFLRPVDSPIGSLLGVPLIQDGKVAGVIALLRRVAQPFTQRQIELVETFAGQAVIAIANVRLFDEVRARTRDLSEALEYQTATSEVLNVISRSPSEVQPVLDVIIETAVRLCEADFGTIAQESNGRFFRTGQYGSISAEFREFMSRAPVEITRGSITGRTLVEGKVVHVLDAQNDPEYTWIEALQAEKIRSGLGVPLLRDSSPIGAIALVRRSVRPFTDKQIELVTTFADQAVIAIENARLFEEVQARTTELSESLKQQTATADVLKAISRSTFDLQAVLDTLVASAATLCDADRSAVYRRDGDLYHWSASYGSPPEFIAFARAHPFSPGRHAVTSRVALEARTIHVSDVLADAEYGATDYQKLGGYRTVLGVPILREGQPIGAFALTRSSVRDFTQRQIELAETFADQAGIAIENARLFDEVQSRTRELTRSLEELRTAQDRLIQTEKLASLGQLTAGIAHEIKNPLNFVNNFAGLSTELVDELRDTLAEARLDKKTAEAVTELTDMLKTNLEKVVQHGKRADSIIKNMLLHSRAGSGEHRPTDINAIVEEALNLAYHGARAEKQGFNITLERTLDPAAGEVDLFPQEITRVLLNLISNGFYAATKRKAAAKAGYEPKLSASTKSLGDRVEIRIRDNGTGIPDDVKERMFNPFFTTKPAGEGTGLGLSLSHDIVVKQHAGTIEVETEPGSFTEFRIVLPRGAALLGKSGDNS